MTMPSRCNFPSLSFSFSLPIPMLAIPFPRIPTIPALNLFCPLD
jgi:hypothetical protein